MIPPSLLRRALLFVPLASLMGCITYGHQIVAGPASYTTSPETAAGSGALTASAVVCTTSGSQLAIAFGEGCVLHARLVTTGSPGSSTGTIRPGATCDLPVAEGHARVQVRDGVASLQMASRLGGPTQVTIDLAITGETSDPSPHVVSYRFKATGDTDVSDDECARILAHP